MKYSTSEAVRLWLCLGCGFDTPVPAQKRHHSPHLGNWGIKSSKVLGADCRCLWRWLRSHSQVDLMMNLFSIMILMNLRYSPSSNSCVILFELTLSRLFSLFSQTAQLYRLSGRQILAICRDSDWFQKPARASSRCLCSH